MSSIADLRRCQYDYHNKLYPYINDWKRNPYTWFKAKFYMEASAVLVYFLLKTKIKPNTVTVVYGLLGLVGGILLAIPTNITVLVAIFIFFLKGILDWSDGHLARIRGQTSLAGDILDSYGALLGALGLQMGLGFYVAQKSGMILFYYLIPLIPLFYAGKLHSYAFGILFNNYITSGKMKGYKKNTPNSAVGSDGMKSNEVLGGKYCTVYNLIRNFLDDRARTVDFVCFLLLLEILTSIFITWIIFLGFVIKRFLIFSVSFYIVARGGWAEKKLEDKIAEISTTFNDKK